MKRGVWLVIGAVLVITLGVVLFLRTRNSSNTGNTITLKIWSPFDEKDATLALGSSFLQQNPNVKLDFTYVAAKDSADYQAKVVDAIAGGTGPDLWLLRTDWLPQHQSKLISSKGIVNWAKGKQSEQAGINDYFGAAVAAQNMRDGQLYTYPVSVDSLGLYINKKVLNTALDDASQNGNDAATATLSTYPATWSDVEKWAQLLAKKSGSQITRGGLAFGTSTNSYAPVDAYTALLEQYGGSLFTTDEKSVAIHLAKTTNGVATIPGVQALSLFTNFSNPASAAYSWSTAMGDPVTALASDKLGMMVGYSTLRSDLAHINSDTSKYVVIPLPQLLDPQNNPRVDYAAYWSYGVAKTSVNSKLAWQLLLAMGKNQEGLNTFEKDTGKPLLSQVGQATITYGGSSFDDNQLFASQVANSQVVYKPRWQETDQAVQDMIKLVTDSHQSSQSAIDSAAEILKKLLVSAQ